MKLESYHGFSNGHCFWCFSPCRRNLVLTDLLAFGYDFWDVAQVYSGALRHFFRSLTTAGDNRDKCQETRLGQYSYLAHDRLLMFTCMALICGFI